MIDAKTKLVLKILAQMCRDGTYKIIEIPDIILALPKKYRTDSDAIRHNISRLEHQDMISIKYEEDDTYCLAVLPYGFEYLEFPTEKKNLRFSNKKNLSSIIFSFCAALFGTVVGIVVAATAAIVTVAVTAAAQEKNKNDDP